MPTGLVSPSPHHFSSDRTFPNFRASKCVKRDFYTSQNWSILELGVSEVLGQVRRPPIPAIHVHGELPFCPMQFTFKVFTGCSFSCPPFRYKSKLHVRKSSRVKGEELVYRDDYLAPTIKTNLLEETLIDKSLSLSFFLWVVVILERFCFPSPPTVVLFAPDW